MERFKFCRKCTFRSPGNLKVYEKPTYLKGMEQCGIYFGKFHNVFVCVIVCFYQLLPLSFMAGKYRDLFFLQLNAFLAD